MRLLLRANSHRPLDGAGLELASSPDTAGRELWQWQLRLDAAQAAPPVRTHVAVAQSELARSDGEFSALSLSTDPTCVTAQIETLEVNGLGWLERDERQLVALVVGRGRVLVERRHLLAELDVLVLEGDDPFAVSLERGGDEPATLGVARLDPVGATRIAWVP